MEVDSVQMVMSFSASQVLGTYDMDIPGLSVSLLLFFAICQASWITGRPSAVISSLVLSQTYTSRPEGIACAMSIDGFTYNKFESNEIGFSYGLRNAEGDTTFPWLMAE